MATPLAERLGQDLTAMNAEWEANFAGQSRRTRSLELLDALSAKAQAVVDAVDAIPSAARGPELGAIREAASGNVALFHGEREAIVEAQAAGPAFDDFAALSHQANVIFGRYRRAYAGKARATRDLLFLEELMGDLGAVRDEMRALAAESRAPSFARDLELVVSTLQMYETERQEIAKAQADGTPEEQASILAALANEQFELYRRHFANQSRATRRPTLLSRIVTSLERARKRMAELEKAGLKDEHNSQNVAIVDTNLKLYRTELAEIRKLRKTTDLGGLMGLLGGAANEIFEAYRDAFAGKDRRGADLETLGTLSERLAEIGRQMDELGRAQSSDVNETNLAIVRDYLGTFEREYELIEAAKAERH